MVRCWDTLEHVPDPFEFLRQVRLRSADDVVISPASRSNVGRLDSLVAFGRSPGGPS